MNTKRGMVVDGPKVKTMIQAMGLKQWHIARKAGISTGHLSNVLGGYRASMPTIQAIADAIGVPVDEILKEAES